MSFFPLKKKTRPSLAVYFDVDGVLNAERDWRTPFLLNEKCLENFVRLDGLLKKKGYAPEYVLCSTWRLGMSGKKPSPQYLDLAEKLKRCGIRISGTTPDAPQKTRRDEVLHHLKMSGTGFFLVIDDDESLYGDADGSFPLYVPDYHTGFSEADAKKAARAAARSPFAWDPNQDQLT